MSELQRYRRRERTEVVAVRLDLTTEGFTYEKWGGVQHCKPGDWLVRSPSDTYTVDGESFAATYREVSLGVYEKQAAIWARRAEAPGTIETKEGSTDYQAGDYLVFNDPVGRDGYAMSSETFRSLYDRD